MNNIHALSKKQFDSLSLNELEQVINAYCEENGYFNQMLNETDFFSSKQDLLNHFDKKINQLYCLRGYFNHWNH